MMNQETEQPNNKAIPEKIYAVNYAGYWELQDGEYYEDTRLLHEDEYEKAEAFSNEVCNRWNSYAELKAENERLKADKAELVQALTDSLITLKAFLPDAWATISKVESTLQKHGQ